MESDQAGRVVLGVGRETSVKAVEWVIERARRRPLSVELIRSFDPLRSTGQAERELLHEVRDRIVAGAPETRVATVLSTDSIHDALLNAGEHADLIVIGSRRHRPVRSVLTGEVPLRVATRAACPTVVVPDDATLRVRGPVVVGVPGDRSGDAALLFAAREARALGAELVAVHGWSATQLSLVGGLEPPSLAADRTRHRRILDEAAATVEATVSGGRLRLLLDRGIPAWVIGDAARRARLVVLGSHRRGPLAGLLLGSTAREVMELTGTPVCIVPPEPEPTSGDERR